MNISNLDNIFSKDIDESVENVKINHKLFKKSQCDEIYLFLILVEKYKAELNDRLRFLIAKKIVSEFLLPNSKKEINLYGENKNNFLKEYQLITSESCPITLFDPLYKECKLVLKTSMKTVIK